VTQAQPTEPLVFGVAACYYIKNMNENA
jgi:hypothetical protein